MQNKIKIIIGLFVFMCGFVYSGQSDERWIDYDDLSKISRGLSQKDLMISLGEPLLVLSNNEGGENTIYLYYNYHVKRYLSKNNERDPQFERTVLIKFIFEDDELISWEEDNITLNMAHQTRPGTVLIKYVNLLINLILLVAVFGG